MIVVLIGMPGCGKGTQASLLLKKFPAEYISVGDVLRSYANKDTKFGTRIRSIIDQGRLLDDHIVSQIVFDAIVASKANNFILDGYPRKLSQAKFLEDNFPDNKILYIYFKIDEKTLIKRLLNRVICANCSHILSQQDILLNSHICPNCLSDNVHKRQDDDLHIIKKRIEVFNSETLSIIEFYNRESNFISIDSTDNIANISKIVFNFIKTH